MRGITIIREVAEKYPDNALASMTLGRMSIRTGQYDKAIQRFDNVLKIEPDNTEAHYWLGMSHKELKQSQKAKFHFEQFLRFSDNEAQKREVRGLLESL